MKWNFFFNMKNNFYWIWRCQIKYHVKKISPMNMFLNMVNTSSFLVILSLLMDLIWLNSNFSHNKNGKNKIVKVCNDHLTWNGIRYYLEGFKQHDMITRAVSSKGFPASICLSFFALQIKKDMATTIGTIWLKSDSCISSHWSQGQ